MSALLPFFVCFVTSALIASNLASSSKSENAGFSAAAASFEAAGRCVLVVAAGAAGLAGTSGFAMDSGLASSTFPYLPTSH